MLKLFFGTSDLLSEDSQPSLLLVEKLSLYELIPNLVKRILSSVSVLSVSVLESAKKFEEPALILLVKEVVDSVKKHVV